MWKRTRAYLRDLGGVDRGGDDGRIPASSLGENDEKGIRNRDRSEKFDIGSLTEMERGPRRCYELAMETAGEELARLQIELSWDQGSLKACDFPGACLVDQTTRNFRCWLCFHRQGRLDSRAGTAWMRACGGLGLALARQKENRCRPR